MIGEAFSGFCLPKDVAAFIHISENLGFNFDILKAVQKVNEYQRELIIRKIKKSLGARLQNCHIGVWGLSFKPNTDDIRESQSIYIINKLLEQKARIKAYDPKAIKETQSILPKINYVNNMYAAAEKADCLFIATEWDEFKNASLQKLKKIMRRPVIIDGRNIFEPVRMKKLGFIYHCIGRT